MKEGLILVRRRLCRVIKALADFALENKTFLNWEPPIFRLLN